MRYLVVLLALALTGCAYKLTLYPRDGGELAYGTLNGATQEMQVTLGADTYKGSYRTGMSFGTSFGFSGTAMATGYGIGSSNQHAAVLTSGAKAMRCQFMADEMGGNGMCIAGDAAYDLVIEPEQQVPQ